jgi:hypothetical protein
MLTNLTDSFGSSFFTSSEWMNKFSRKDHDLWTSPAVTTISLIAPRALFQYVILSSKVERYLDVYMELTAC